MSGRLTTHVLDVSKGLPAEGMHIQLWQLSGSSQTVPRLVREAITNADGRLDAPLLKEEELEVGLYELVFDVEAYFAASEAGENPAGGFLEKVPIRFRIADPQLHYHVPLLIAPGGYSTYRGS